MSKRETKNLAASIHGRLLNKAKEEGRPFNELLQYFAMERFLYRLSKSTHAREFVLKGASRTTTISGCSRASSTLMGRSWQQQSKRLSQIARERSMPL